MNDIDVRIGEANGFSPEEQAKLLQLFKDQMLSQAAGTLHPELAATHTDGAAIRLHLHHSSATLLGIDYLYDMRSFEYEPPIPTDLQVTFDFYGDPCNPAQRYELKRDAIKVLEELFSKVMQPGWQTPRCYVFISMEPPAYRVLSIHDDYVYTMADDTLIFHFAGDGEALRVKATGWLPLKDFKELGVSSDKLPPAAP